MTALDPAWPGTLSDRAYLGRRALGGGWRIVAGWGLWWALKGLPADLQG